MRSMVLYYQTEATWMQKWIEHESKGKVTNHLFLKTWHDVMTWSIMKASKKTTNPLEQVVKSYFNDITHLFVCILQWIVLNKHLRSLSNKLHEDTSKMRLTLHWRSCANQSMWAIWDCVLKLQGHLGTLLYAWYGLCARGWARIQPSMM